MTTNSRQLPTTLTGGESIWIGADNTAESKTDITIDGATPAGGYSLSFQFAAPDEPLTVAAVANDEDTGWTLDVSSAQTLAWLGRVGYTAFLEDGDGHIFVVEQGIIFVQPSPLRVSSWKAVITAVDAAMLTSAATPNGSMSVDGVSISYRGVSDLTAIRAYAERKLGEEMNGRVPRRILSRFI